MPHKYPETPPPVEPTGMNAIVAALARFAFPIEHQELVRCGGELAFEFRKGQPVRLRDALELLPPRRYERPEEAASAIHGALDERRGADRRVAPPRIGRVDGWLG
jgi:hypothetical protein